MTSRAKDFRTWGGTVLAAAALSAFEPPDTKRSPKPTSRRPSTTSPVSLGNTPTICRKCYVHPALLEAYLDGEFKLAQAQSAPASRRTKARC